MQRFFRVDNECANQTVRALISEGNCTAVAALMYVYEQQKFKSLFSH